MWHRLIIDIKKIEEKYGDTLNDPAPKELIEIFKKTVEKKLNHILPDKYIRFLENVNGLEYNGFIFYGIDNILSKNNSKNVYGYIETNQIWYENEDQKQYMFFGESDISWYCYDLTNKVYVELDNPSGTLMETFNNFDTMLEKALKDSLS